LTIAALRWLGKRDPTAESAAAVTIAGNAIAFMACLPLAIGGGHFCLTRSIRHLRAVDAATLLLLEPVLSPIWAWLIHHEQPSGRALAGGATIMAAAFAGSWWQSRREPIVAGTAEGAEVPRAALFPPQS